MTKLMDQKSEKRLHTNREVGKKHHHNCSLSIACQQRDIYNYKELL